MVLDQAVGHIFGHLGLGHLVLGEVSGGKPGAVDASGEAVIVIDKLEVGLFDATSQLAVDDLVLVGDGRKVYHLGQPRESVCSIAEMILRKAMRRGLSKTDRVEISFTVLVEGGGGFILDKQSSSYLEQERGRLLAGPLCQLLRNTGLARVERGELLPRSSHDCHVWGSTGGNWHTTDRFPRWAKPRRLKPRWASTFVLRES